MSKEYLKRLAEDLLYIKLNSAGCVVVNGPKFCGKSTMCEQYAKSVTKLKSSELKLPKIKMIITSHGPCYKSKEGIYIVPITMLKN